MMNVWLFFFTSGAVYATKPIFHYRGAWLLNVLAKLLRRGTELSLV